VVNGGVPIVIVYPVNSFILQQQHHETLKLDPLYPDANHGSQ